MKQIAVYLADGFEEIEAITIIDVLRRAEQYVVVVSVSGNKLVTGSHNITIAADVLFEEFYNETSDMIILPGGMPGSVNLKNHAELNELILSFSKNKKMLGAICAAPIVFGNLGLLENKKATCYPGFENQLRGAEITGKDVEVAENIITGKGAGVALDFVLKIVEQIRGKEYAFELGKKMIVY